MTSFLVALQFLTRIPIKLKQQSTEKQSAQSLLFYPVVGLLIGLVIYVLNIALSEANDMLRAAIVLVIWVLITGALHLDGLADSADAWIGGFGDKDKTLAIMKDPYCGPVGVVTLVLVLLLKFSLIISITEELGFLLILVPFLARTSVIWSFLSIPYVRENGLGTIINTYFPKRLAIILLATISCCIVLVSGWLGIIFLLFISCFIFLLKRILLKRIEGMTGDILGAQIEILEASLLLVGLLVSAY